jgi:diguanylate cyclase (GGDEF)-like protein
MNATLLVVDDDPMSREVLARRLARRGYRMLVADSGEAALDIAGRHRIDAVLLDSVMPGLSGLDTLRTLRQTRSAAELPVIMVTGKDRSEDVVEALDLGANDYVTKPIDFPVVLARIRTQVTARRADPLTGLANRAVFLDQLDRLMARSRQSAPPPCAVFFLDIDRFKLINESLGHQAGDELLVGLARRLESALRAADSAARTTPGDVLARFGGDEFAIVVDGLADLAAAEAMAARLLAISATPFEIQGREVFATVSIGLVMSAARYTSGEDLLRDADTAMQRAKSRGRARYEIFDTSMLAAVEQQLQLESDLRHAIERRELVVHYQPIVALDTNRICGFEALLRWRHPTRGVISAADFIPLAEQNELILPIGNWVLAEACRQLRAWDAECPGCADVSMNVNLSARQFMDPQLVESVRRVLAESGLAAERLKLEITETVVLENSETVIGILNELRALGIQLGLDDFGMGYSALSYLQRFPFQTLKIDRTFVSGMEQGKTGIVRAILSLADALAMTVIAEGVETAEQASELRKLACGFGQGFFFEKPLPADEARAVLRERCSPAAPPFPGSRRA